MLRSSGQGIMIIYSDKSSFKVFRNAIIDLGGSKKHIEQSSREKCQVISLP